MVTDMLDWTIARSGSKMPSTILLPAWSSWAPPHAGSHVADAARVKALKAIARATFKKAPEKLTKALSAHSAELQDLSDSFERTTIFTQHVIEICTYFETKTTMFAGEEVCPRCVPVGREEWDSISELTGDSQVVPRDMAVLHYMNERREPIAREHTKMAKFSSVQDDLYLSVCERLKDMGADGLDMQRARQGP